MHRVTPLLSIGLCLILLTAIAPAEREAGVKKYLPKTFKKLRFGMSLVELKKQRKNKLTDASDDTYDFRKIYKEEINATSIVSAVYYFDNEGDLPLYEMIVVYESEEARNKAARSLLGKPNYKEKEWKIDIGDEYPLHAWTYKNKIIYAVPLKGSEWENELE